MISADIGVWIAAILTIMTLSFVYRQNILFQIAEHVFIAVAVGYTVAVGVNNVLTVGYGPLMRGSYIYLIPMVLGVLMYARFSKGLFWLSRWPIALLTGVGAGLMIRGLLASDLTAQVVGTLNRPLASFNDILFVFLVVSTLSYFIFSKRMTNRPMQFLGRIGRYTMMVAFGAGFGGTVMTRMTLLIGRIQFLLLTWLGLRA